MFWYGDPLTKKPPKDLKIPIIKKKKPNNRGKNSFQIIFINVSNLYLGLEALTKTKHIQKNITLVANINELEKINKDQPPKKNKTNNEFISIILLYSAKKNIAKNNEEYSTL